MHPGAQIGPGLLAGGVPISNEGRTAHVDASTSLTASGVAIGTADANRLVVVAIGGRYDSGAGYSTVTIGGVSATIHDQTDSNSDERIVCIASAIVPTGTTANVVVTLTGGSVRSGNGICVAAFALYNCTFQQIAKDSVDTGSQGTRSAPLTDVEAGNYLIGITQGTGSSVDFTTNAGMGNESRIDLSEESVEVADNFNAAGGSMTPTASNAYGLLVAEFGA